MIANPWALLILPTLILVGALITDLRHRKIYNWYIVPCALLALLQSLYFFGWPGVGQAFAGFGLAILLCLPLVMVGVLGGGDLKLFAVFGLATSYSIVFSVIVAAFIWAAVFGVIYALVRGSFFKLVTNMGALSTGGKANQMELHKIPFAIPIFIGWMSYLVQNYGGLL